MISDLPARPGRLYAIADLERLGVEAAPEAVAAMAESGIETIQIRAKNAVDAELAVVCGRAFERLEGWSGQLWIDDRCDLAMLFPFAGVHLGQRDLAPAMARARLPREVGIGHSTHDEPQLRDTDRDAAVDWIGIGPIFPTRSKASPDTEIGLAELRRLRQLTAKPLIAIGGVDASNLESVLATGVDSVAVLSALCDGDVGANCRRLLARLRSGSG